MKLPEQVLRAVYGGSSLTIGLSTTDKHEAADRGYERQPIKFTFHDGQMVSNEIKFGPWLHDASTLTHYVIYQNGEELDRALLRESIAPQQNSILIIPSIVAQVRLAK